MQDGTRAYRPTPVVQTRQRILQNLNKCGTSLAEATAASGLHGLARACDPIQNSLRQILNSYLSTLKNSEDSKIQHDAGTWAFVFDLHFSRPLRPLFWICLENSAIHDRPKSGIYKKWTLQNYHGKRPQTVQGEWEDNVG